MAEALEDSQNLESTTVHLWRNAKVVKGGRRFSLSALVVVGDRQGSVGIGYGKATGAPAAIEKAQKAARKNLNRVNLQGDTIPHQVQGRFCASSVRLIPAAPGTGVIASGTVRAVLEMAGIRDCLTKSYGSNNQKNLCKATMEGLRYLRTKSTIANLRGVDLEETDVERRVAQGQRYAPVAAGTDQERARGPVNKVGQRSGGGGRNRQRGRGRGRGEGGFDASGGGDASASSSPQETTPSPAPDATPPAGGEEASSGS